MDEHKGFVRTQAECQSADFEQDKENGRIDGARRDACSQSCTRTRVDLLKSENGLRAAFPRFPLVSIQEGRY
jgi:hypothetical protein